MSARDSAVSITNKHGEPIHRTQRWPLPESQTVIAVAKQRRLSWLEAMARVSHSQLTEQEREARQEVIEGDLDYNADLDKRELQE